MSVERNYYVIAGYDLTDWNTDKYEDWKWTEEGENYTYNQVKGKIQFFDDPMNGTHLYLGYILAEIDMWNSETSMFDVDDIKNKKGQVEAELVKLRELGIISKDPKFIPEYKVIVFEECR